MSAALDTPGRRIWTPSADELDTFGRRKWTPTAAKLYGTREQSERYPGLEKSDENRNDD